MSQESGRGCLRSTIWQVPPRGTGTEVETPNASDSDELGLDLIAFNLESLVAVLTVEWAEFSISKGW